MEKLLLYKNVLTWCEVAVITILVIVLIVLKKKYGEMRKRREIAEMNARNEILNERLKNPDSEIDWSKNPKPFEVEYVLKMDSHKEKASDIQIEIEVHAERSVQRYLFDLNEKITIGNSEKNTLPLNDQTIAGRSCTIAMKNKSVYLINENLNEPICIQRGKNKSFITNQIVKLQSKDILILGKMELYISMFKN